MTTIALLFLCQAQAYRAIPYFDPQGRAPSSYREYAATAMAASLEARVVARGAGTYSQLVLVFVNAQLYPEIQPDLATYASDLSAAGYSTKFITVQGGRAADLRRLLQVHRDSGLIGSVMIGNLPVAWWSDGSAGEDYPLDFFFTDLDGAWTDGNGDGLYDSHTGSIEPDIWLGRIDASRFTYGSEVQVMHDYFQRNHLFRTGQLAVPHRGLVLSNVFYADNHGMNNMLSNVTNYGCTLTTTASFYKAQLQAGYEFVHLVSHSSPWVNSFFYPDGSTQAGSVFNFEIPMLGPHAVFYFLNACMCSRFTERDNLGNWYALCSPFGQVVLGSSQTMYGIDDLSDLYSYLGHDSTIGGAFLQWHRNNYDWYPATCILGDPTLKVNRSEGPEARGPGSPTPDPRPQSFGWTVYPVDTCNFVCGRPRIGCSKGRIRLLYDSGKNVRSDNYFSWFNGTSFTRPESVAWHDYYDLFPACCTDSSGRFWMVWQSFRDYDQGYEHFQLFSTYYDGTNWSGVNRIGTLAHYHDLQPSLAAGRGDTVWCAFQSWRTGQADIWVSNEAHAGTWTTPVALTTDSLEQLYPCITVDHANRPWVFWQSQANGRWCIQGRVNDGGWQPVFCLDSIGESGPPKAVTDAAGRVWVFWHRAEGGRTRVFCSRHEGLNWTVPEVVASDSGDDMLPDACAMPDGSVWACWQSDTGANGSGNIYVAHYAGGWSQPQAITLDNVHNIDPTIGADTSGNVWVAWASDRRGYFNIYAATAAATGVPAFNAVNRVEVAATPNPFYSQVRFTGPRGFSVDIYDAGGRRLTRLAAADGKACWAPGRLARGVYLARVTSEARSANVKLVYTR